MAIRRELLTPFQQVAQYITVCAYIFCVSIPAIILAVFYTCIWDPKYVNEQLHQYRNIPKPLQIQIKSSGCDCSTCPRPSLHLNPPKPKVDLSHLLITATIPGPRTTQKVPVH